MIPEGDLERTVNGALATSGTPSPMPIFDFNSDVVYQQTLGGYRLDDREINAHLLIKKRKEVEFDFLLFLRHNNGRPILPRRGREFNFAITNTNGFTLGGLMEYIGQNELQITWPEEVISLEREYDQLDVKKEAIWSNELFSIPVKYAKSDPIKKRMGELEARFVPLKTKSALEQVGQQWIGYIQSNLRPFIEDDGTEIRHYGLGGGGPHVRNILNAAQIPELTPGLSIPGYLTVRGSYGSGRKSR